MLKIKDNIDLKELEKYGIDRNEGIYYDMFTGEKKSAPNYSCEDFKNNKHIIIRESDREICFISNNDFLYDLIKDGLVEKK